MSSSSSEYGGKVDNDECDLATDIQRSKKQRPRTILVCANLSMEHT